MLSPSYKKISPLLVTLLLLWFTSACTRTPTPAPITQQFPDPTNFASPYGFTNRAKLNATLVNEYEELNVHWIRDQMLWTWIETARGQYSWSVIDQQVQLANAHHIHFVFVIQKAPDWHHVICRADNRPFVFGAKDVTEFATVLASRYNGTSGHGYIDAYEIGNEDFDVYWDGHMQSSVACRTPDYYVPVLEAGYHAIKAQSPHALVGMFGMWWEDKAHEQAFVNGMYQIDPNVGKYFDYGNLHFYTPVGPDQHAPNDLKRPTFAERWQIMHTAMVEHGDGRKPIWITEVGWDNTDPQLQNHAMLYVFDQARQSHVIQKIFWYTINWDKKKDINPGDLTPGLPPQPAFYTYKKYVQQYPVWVAS